MFIFDLYLPYLYLYLPYLYLYLLLSCLVGEMLLHKVELAN